MLTEPVTCSSCGAVSVNGGTIHCHGCYKRLEARITHLTKMLDAALDDDWENPELVAYRTTRSGWRTE